MSKLNIQAGYGRHSQTYHDAVAIRLQVFVAEEGIDRALELDEFDDEATHWVGYLEGQPITTLRVRTIHNGDWKIQRVATSKVNRGHGYAGELMKAVLQQAIDEEVSAISLDSQDQAVGFYQRFGFEINGPQFLEAGIDHFPMIFQR